MTYWIDFRIEPVNESLHEVIREGTQVECNYIYCNYSERFDNVEDAETAMEIHEKSKEH